MSRRDGVEKSTPNKRAVIPRGPLGLGHHCLASCRHLRAEPFDLHAGCVLDIEAADLAPRAVAGAGHEMHMMVALVAPAVGPMYCPHHRYVPPRRHVGGDLLRDLLPHLGRSRGRQTDDHLPGTL